MRILRGQSNSEVSYRGFAWFVVGLVLATFIGGAVRTILTSDRVHRRIESELRARFPKHSFQIGRTEVLLSSGLWPGLGLKVNNLIFRQEVCDKLSFVLEVPTAILPVDMLSLRHGRVRLGRAQLLGGKIHLDYKACPSEPGETPKPQSPAAAAAASKPSLAAVDLNWRKIGEQLDAVELRDFQITYERNLTWKVLVKTVDVEFGREEMNAEGLVEIVKGLPFGSLAHTFDFEARGEGAVLEWEIASEFKEGRVNLKGSVDLNTQAATIRVGARQLPLKDLMSELFLMGFVERDLQLKTTWLSCQLAWEGQLQKPETSPVDVRDCKLEGGYGRLELEEASYWMGQEPMFREPARVRVERMQMQPILEATGRKVLPAVVSRPGVWSGELRMSGHSAWQLDGFLEGTEVRFSNRSVRGKQILSRLRTRVEKRERMLHGQIEDVQILGGSFEGGLRFRLQEDWRNGNFEADVRDMRFNKSIQNLLVGGTMGPASVKGQGTLQDGELTVWQGRFALEEARGIGWWVRGIEVDSKYQLGKFRLDTVVHELGAEPTWTHFTHLRTIDSDVNSSMAWREARARFEIERAGGTVTGGSAQETGSGRTWRFQGSWVRDGKLNGTLSLGERTYSLIGEKGALAIEPQNLSR